MRCLGLVWALLIAVFATPASASRTRRVGDYRLSIERGSLYLTRGTARVLIGAGIAIEKATIDRATNKLTLVAQDTDKETGSIERFRQIWDLAALEAQLENAAALALHRKGDYRGAAAHFERAIALLPAWDAPAFGQASALRLDGDLDGAARVLAPWLAAKPVATYVRVATDPDLKPLLGRPELIAARAARPGNAQLTPNGTLVGNVAFAPERSLLAVTDRSGNGGSSVFSDVLQIFDGASAELIAEAVIIKAKETRDDCSEDEDDSACLLPGARATVATRIRALSTMLVELGFVVTPVERGKTTPAGHYRFERAKLGVVANGQSVGLLRRDQTLATGPTLHKLTEAHFVEAAGAAVVRSYEAGGCHGEQTQWTVLPVSPRAAPEAPQDPTRWPRRVRLPPPRGR